MLDRRRRAARLCPGVTAPDISSRLATLREAGAKLRRRPARDTLAGLARVLDGWRDPASAWRRELVAELPGATGFAPATVSEGLARGLDEFRGDALLALVENEFGGVERLDAPGAAMVSGFDTTAVVLAGSIPMPSLLAILAPLVLRSPVLAKSASRDPVTAPLVARSIAETDAELAQCVDVVDFSRDDEPSLRALLAADCVVATGSDAAVGAIAGSVAPPRRFVGYGHRLSVAALGPAACRGAALARAAERLALDIALWDQSGCLSPVVVYAAADPDAVADALAAALDAAQARWPRGAVDLRASAAIAHERAEAELRGAGGRAVRVLAGEAWTVVREDTAAPRPAPLHRFTRVLPVTETVDLVAAMRPLGSHLAAVAVEGFGSESDAVFRALSDLGASRICAPGRMQCPPLAWRHDNRGVLLPLARVTDAESSE